MFFDIVARGADINIERLSREKLVKAFNTRYVDDQQIYALLQDALKSQEITQIVYKKKFTGLTRPLIVKSVLILLRW